MSWTHAAPVAAAWCKNRQVVVLSLDHVGNFRWRFVEKTRRVNLYSRPVAVSPPPAGSTSTSSIAIAIEIEIDIYIQADSTPEGPSNHLG